MPKICYGRKTQALREAALRRATRPDFKTLALERELRYGIHKKASAMANIHSSNKIIYDINTKTKKSERAKRVDWRKAGKGYKLK
jgi:hypothetical protein